MSLISKLKRALGLGSRAEHETPVSVERERAGSRDAADATASTAGVDESPPGGSVVDEPPAESGDTAVDDAAPTASESPGSDAALTTIKGIGPAYAERLESAGVGSVGELAVADAAALAESTDLSAKRIQGWIDRAAAQE